MERWECFIFEESITLEKERARAEWDVKIGLQQWLEHLTRLKGRNPLGLLIFLWIQIIRSLETSGWITVWFAGSYFGLSLLETFLGTVKTKWPLGLLWEARAIWCCDSILDQVQTVGETEVEERTEKEKGVKPLRDELASTSTLVQLGSRSGPGVPVIWSHQLG